MSSSDYNYDAEGQFYPFFILTIVGFITIPLTYNVLKADTNVEAAAPPAEYNYKPGDEDLIQESKRKAKRRERKLKRMLAAAVGYLVMAGMVYLIIVTARITPRIYDPYQILGVSRVCPSPGLPFFRSQGTAARVWVDKADFNYRVRTIEPSKNSITNSP
jgi:translocation protein SEC63